MSASSIKCVVRRTTRFLHFSFNKDHMSRLEYGSIPLVGSSKMTTFQLCTQLISNMIFELLTQVHLSPGQEF